MIDPTSTSENTRPASAAADLQTQHLISLLERQESASKKSLQHSKLQTGLLIAIALVLCVFVSFVVIYGPQFLQMFDTTSAAMSEITAVLDSTDTSTLIDGVQELLSTTSADMEKVLSSVSAIDFEGLNNSIRTLDAITAAMGRLFGIS